MANQIVDILIVVIISLVLTVIYEFIKQKIPVLDHDTQDVINYTAAFVGIFVVLLLTFTITNYMNRYTDLIDDIQDDTNEMILITEFLKQSPNSQDILDVIRKYSQTVLNNPNDLNTISLLYYQINRKIIQYVNTTSTPYNDEILSRLRANHSISKNIELYNIVDDFLFAMTIFFLIITLIVFLYIRIPIKIVQYTIDFCIIAITVGAVYIIYRLNSLYKTAIRINPSPYNEILEIINDENF